MREHILRTLIGLTITIPILSMMILVPKVPVVLVVAICVVGVAWFIGKVIRDHDYWDND